MNWDWKAIFNTQSTSGNDIASKQWRIWCMHPLPLACVCVWGTGGGGAGCELPPPIARGMPPHLTWIGKLCFPCKSSPHLVRYMAPSERKLTAPSYLYVVPSLQNLIQMVNTRVGWAGDTEGGAFPARKYVLSLWNHASWVYFDTWWVTHGDLVIAIWIWLLIIACFELTKLIISAHWYIWCGVS